MSGSQIVTQIAFPQGPIVDLKGALTPMAQRFLLALWQRTGGGVGVSTATLQAQLSTAIQNAAQAQKTANQASMTAMGLASVVAEAENDARVLGFSRALPWP